MKKFLIGASLFALPFLASAQADFSNFDRTVTSLQGFIDKLIPLVIGIALLLFLIGIVRFVTAGGDEEARASARWMIIFGIIALFVMVSVWGFVRILTSTFFGGQDISQIPTRPTVPAR